MNSYKFVTVDEYLSSFPTEIRDKLMQIRNTIKITVPNAEELISYNMPAFKFHGILVYFAAQKKHIGFYPANTEVLEVFKEQLTNYKTSKRTIQIPLDEKIPLNLLKQIVIFRAEQNIQKETSKTSGRLKKLNKA
jgi:uncharacterized protein YdhG (YjbR/CyaY superfamily)